MRNKIASLIMLPAGVIAILCCILLQYTLEATLLTLVIVLFVFMILGFIAQKIINTMTKEAEERFQEEEAKRKEAEEQATLEETEQKENSDSSEVEPTNQELIEETDDTL